MKIDKNNLIDLLVEKTDMEREEIEDQLDQLIERILDAAKRGKALEIKEFGLFYFDEEGELSFDPAEELRTEISFKYAGMKPVELQPERDTSISEPEETGEDEQYDEWKDEVGDEEEDQTDPFASAEFKEKEEESEIKNDNLYAPFAPEAMESLEEPVEEEPASKMEDIKPVSRQPLRKRRDPTGVFILIGIILVAVIIGGYFYYIGSQTQNLDEQAEATVPASPNTESQENASTDELTTTDTETETDGPDQVMADPTQTDTEQQNSDQVSEEQIVSDTDVSTSETEQPMYGLKGSVLEEANTNSYSIVLHSFATEDRANTAAERLRQDGYRVIITSRTVYENMVWRVSVGQFETLRDAQQATTQLPSPYNTQNFIHRIRT